MNLKKILSYGCFSFLSFTMIAQQGAPDNWFNLDKTKDGVQGVSTEETYKKLLAGKESQTIIVAVLDSGVDFEHEDLKDVMWNNPGEIPGNGKDDDGNGYIDDIHGWSFIGGKNGNVNKDSYEITREYKRLGAKYEGKTLAQVAKKDRKEFEYYSDIKQTIEEKRAEMSERKKFVEEYFESISDAFARVKGALKGQEFTEENIDNIDADGKADLSNAIATTKQAFARGLTPDNFAEQLKNANDYFDSSLNYGYNPDFNPRAIIGDNYADPYEKYYGNADCIGPDASHGTHVAGIIAASRGNGIGMDGVANNVKIMSVRCVPDGDERDKDVANAIIYAVDNGASIINMSFGKGYSPRKEVVDAAVKYALKNDVLLVHAAGNDNDNNDTSPNFPNDGFAKKGLFKPKKAKNWMEIGALDWKGGENSAARFSNYGAENVDIFAPGVAIYSTTPDNNYASFQGTSMASPCAAGVAAILRSYFPELTATQVKDIMLTSATPITGLVKVPGSSEKVPFSKLCVSGGVANTFSAVKLAQTTKGKGKSSSKWRKAAGAKKVVRP